MTFFYDLNKKLDAIREKPEVTNKQLNERDEGKPGKNFEKIAKDAGERYGSKAAGERVAGAVRNKLKKAGKLEEADMDESAFQAAIGKKKYGEQGMKALQKAGREGKSLEPIRKKYDRYDESEVAEPPTDYKEPTSRYDYRQMDKKVETPAYQRKALGAKPLKLGDVTHSKNRDASEGIEDRLKDLDPKNPVNIPAYQRKAAEQGGSQKKESVIYDIGAGLAGAVKSGAKKAMKALSPDKPKPTYKPFPRGYEGSGQEKADYDAFTGRKDYGGLDSDQERQFKEAGAPMTAKQKSFAKLAPPKDKITFADKIAGAKKEVDEMLGDVAAEAMKAALSPKQKKIDMNKNGKLDANDFAMLRKGGKAREETDEGWDDMMRDVKARADKPKVGTITRGHKHDIEHTATGMKVTRRVDDQGMSVGTDDDDSTDAPKRGRGRPKGTKAAIGAKGPSGKSKLMAREAGHDASELKAAAALLKKAGYKITKAKDSAEELDEKAVSKDQAVAARIARGVQKGEVKAKPGSASAEMAKMEPKELKKFAKTDTKGLPKKVKNSEAPKKKKEKTEEAGGTGTPTASSGFSFGKGIYDSMNRELETMIAEGMNISMNMNNDGHGGPSKSLTITATDDDALKLSALLKNAGLGGGDDQGYGGTGYKSACGCGTPDCSCGKEEMDEAYGDTTPTENAPDYPTNTETSNDALQYSGGLNKPKSTGQTTVPVIASQEERQKSYADMEEDAIKRMMEMAGQPTSGMGAQVGDMIDYVSPSGEQPSEDLIMQNGVQYDPDTNVISVRNATSLAATHRAIEAAGWKKQTAGARPNPAAAGQAQQVGDTPYQLGEEDELARMMEMAGVKKKEVDEEKTDEGNKFTAGLADDDIKVGQKIPGTNAIKKKDIDEGILASTVNLWKAYKG